MLQSARRLRPPSYAAAFSTSRSDGPVKRQTADVKPAPPEPQVIVEPEEVGAWDRPDPKFATMSQKVVGIITTRPGGKQEMGDAVVTEQFSRPMPSDRHTTLLSGPDEDTIIAAGTLNVKQLREIFILYQGQGMDEQSISKKYNVSAELLQRVFRHTSLAVADQTGDGIFRGAK